MTGFEDYWRNRSLIYATDDSLALEAFNAGFKAGMKRAMEIAEREEDACCARDGRTCPEMIPDAESGCQQVRYAIEAEIEKEPPK